MDNKGFMKEFNHRVENRYLHHVHAVRSTMSAKEQTELSLLPASALKAMYLAGANAGIKTLAEMVKEGYAITTPVKKG